MAKNMTPAIQKIEAKKAAQKGKNRKTGPAYEAWLRLIRNRTAILGLVILVALVLVAIFAPVIAPYGYDEISMSDKMVGPCLAHPFGTDQLGRDMFTRCIYGTRITLPVAVLAVTVAVLVGGTIGVIAAYFGGSVDNILMRFVDIWGSIPGIMLAIAIVAVFSGEGASTFQRELSIVCGLSMGAVPNMARTFRGAIFTVIDNDYVESSRSMGASAGRIMLKHLLPNAVGPVILSVVGLLGVEVLCVSATVPVPVSRCYDHAVRPGLQPAGRRPARRTGPETEVKGGQTQWKTTKMCLLPRWKTSSSITKAARTWSRLSTA